MHASPTSDHLHRSSRSACTSICITHLLSMSAVRPISMLNPITAYRARYPYILPTPSSCRPQQEYQCPFHGNWCTVTSQAFSCYSLMNSFHGEAPNHVDCHACFEPGAEIPNHTTQRAHTLKMSRMVHRPGRKITQKPDRGPEPATPNSPRSPRFRRLETGSTG
ncbi:uncharacterized protein BCR38DRAFT_38740 [Pseudomassariella vexata]|uniref:Uncharacterized protein n=1 Tax=Pseudomassariella vexata TaxID=1141098 RepID=A0A1Y2DR30_9PEZI|nr:uncharacterized protein BCR38DRAFT_38740 [Pseudomassariella vexata]ORY61720.1 hypothetical protein BCR38DRAFT_38740 [Pseudomassariella vexata]